MHNIYLQALANKRSSSHCPEPAWHTAMRIDRDLQLTIVPSCTMLSIYSEDFLY